MKVDIGNIKDIPIIRLSGRFDGRGAAIFEKNIKALGDPEQAGWIIDFSKVDYLSSAGIRALIIAAKKFQQHNGTLCLCGLTPQVAFVLETTGLTRIFKIFNTIEEAKSRIRHTTSATAPPVHEITEHADYEICRFPENNCIIETWGRPHPDAIPAISKETLEPVTLNEIGFSIGIGGFGADRSQAAEATGVFVATGSFAGVLPADGHCRPDFFITRQPADAVLYVASAIGLEGRPNFQFTVSGDTPVSQSHFIRDVFHICEKRLQQSLQAFGYVLFADAAVGSAAYFETKDRLKNCIKTKKPVPEKLPVIVVGVAINNTLSPSDTIAPSITPHLPGFVSRNELPIYSHAVFVSQAPNTSKIFDPMDIVAMLSDLDIFQEVLSLESETMLSGIQAWIYIPDTVRPGLQKRLTVEFLEDIQWPDEWDIIARKIYTDAARVELSSLYGGFVATTFKVNGYDAAGRRLLPTVLKIGTHDIITREEAACRAYVEKYILNNGAQILATARQGKWAGICYNFVGVSGPESRLVWLRDHYLQRPVEELLFLFDRIFTDILKPWYGQPHLEHICPYKEHLPDEELFPNILKDALDQLGISPDEPMIDCPEIGTRLPNPYYILKHVYPERQDKSVLWYTGITHGDLNMQNILLDERENIYIIDFSETGPRNIVSDFARLEPIVLFETTRLNSDNDLEELLTFIQGVYSVKTIDEAPSYTYAGNDPMVEKAYALVCRIRKYADTVTLFEKNPMPYWMAVLQWTLPAVSYSSFTNRQKRLALYTSCFLCKNIS